MIDFLTNCKNMSINKTKDEIEQIFNKNFSNTITKIAKKKEELDLVKRARLDFLTSKFVLFSAKNLIKRQQKIIEIAKEARENAESLF